MSEEVPTLPDWLANLDDEVTLEREIITKQNLLRSISDELKVLNDGEPIRDFKEAERVISNPVRGITDDNQADRTFTNVRSRKLDSVYEMGYLLEDEYDADVYNCLWNIALSDGPGMDINWKAIEALQSGAEKLPKEVINKLKYLALRKEKSKEAAFAAKLLINLPKSKVHLTDTEDLKVQRLTQVAEAFDPDFLARHATSFSFRYDGTLSNFAGVEMYRLATERVRNGKCDWDDGVSLIEDIKGKVAQKIDKIKAREAVENTAYGNATLGVELQGWLHQAVETLSAKGENIFKRFSPSDYSKIKDIGNFMSSPDKYFEIPTLPTKYPLELCLTIQDLHKMGLLRTEKGATSMQITIGGLKAGDSFREPAAIQFLVMASDRCRSSMVSEEQNLKAWRHPHREKTAVGKADALRNVEGVEEVKSGAELRLLVLDDLPSTYKTLFEVKFLGDLAVEKQRMTLGREYSPSRALVWDNIMAESSAVFVKHGLPPLTEKWTVADLQKLNRISDGPHSNLKNEIRRLVTRARITMALADSPEMVSQKETDETKSASQVIEATFNKLCDLASLEPLKEKLSKELRTKMNRYNWPYELFPMLDEGKVPLLRMGGSPDLIKLGVINWVYRKLEVYGMEKLINNVKYKLAQKTATAYQYIEEY